MRWKHLWLARKRTWLHLLGWFAKPYCCREFRRGTRAYRAHVAEHQRERAAWWAEKYPARLRQERHAMVAHVAAWLGCPWDVVDEETRDVAIDWLLDQGWLEGNGLGLSEAGCAAMLRARDRNV